MPEEEEIKNLNTNQVAISNVIRSSQEGCQSEGSSSVQESIPKKASCEQYLNINNLIEESAAIVRKDTGESENEHSESPMEVTSSDCVNKLQENDDLKVKKKSDTTDERLMSCIEKGLEVDNVPHEKQSNITINKKDEITDKKIPQVLQQRVTFTVDSNVAQPAVVVIDDDVENRSEEHTSELQSRQYLVCRLLLEKKNKKNNT